MFPVILKVATVHLMLKSKRPNWALSTVLRITDFDHVSRGSGTGLRRRRDTPYKIKGAND